MENRDVAVAFVNTAVVIFPLVIPKLVDVPEVSDSTVPVALVNDKAVVVEFVDTRLVPPKEVTNQLVEVPLVKLRIVPVAFPNTNPPLKVLSPEKTLIDDVEKSVENDPVPEL